jgi:hypothetical protein
MTAETQVKFNLWAVLTFLVVTGCASFTFLYAAGQETKAVQKEVLMRVTKLETQYSFIIEKLGTLTVSIDKASDTIAEHRIKTEKRMTNGNIR